MKYKIEDLVEELKIAREIEGYSQQHLSKISGIPQPQISNFERGKLNPTLSGFVTMSHALGLEVVLVPRKTLPAVRSVIRNSDKRVRINSKALRSLNKLSENLKRLRKQMPKNEYIHRLGQYLAELQQFVHLMHSSDELQVINKILDSVKSETDGSNIQNATEILKSLYESLSQSSKVISTKRKQRPAFSLENSGDEEIWHD